MQDVLAEAWREYRHNFKTGLAFLLLLVFVLPFLYHPRLWGASAMVALGGPASNLLLVVAALIGYKIASLGFLGADLSMTLMKAFGFAIMINLLLATFNLLPVFPLDGSHIAMEYLPDNWLEVYEKHIPYGMYIIIILMLTGALKYLVFFPIMLITQVIMRFLL